MTCTTMFAFKLQATTTTTCQSQRCPNMEFSIGVEVRLLVQIGNFFSPPFFLWFWPPRAHTVSPKKVRYCIQANFTQSEKYRSDLALTLSLYLYSGLLLILHIKNTDLPICMVVIYAPSTRPGTAVSTVQPSTIYRLRLASLAVDCVTSPPYNKAGIVSCAHNITHTSVCQSVEPVVRLGWVLVLVLYWYLWYLFISLLPGLNKTLPGILYSRRSRTHSSLQALTQAVQ